ncbi:hypothetical protein V6M85_08275 [Sulfolobus tengchongensis]|uniref:Uncharacterized protein n=1 Tax=Sulfolobus tengchongensis TaxID=207809 RepID=A0AAX4KXL6_9CREN
MNFDTVTVSLLFDALPKEAFNRLLSNEKVKLYIPTIPVGGIPFMLNFTFSYDDLSFTVYNVGFPSKTKTIFQVNRNISDMEALRDVIEKLARVGDLVGSEYLIEMLLSYTLDYELKRVENPFKSVTGYVFVDFDINSPQDLRLTSYLLDVRIVPNSANPKKTSVQLVYRDKRIDINKIEEIMNKVKKFLEGEK